MSEQHSTNPGTSDDIDLAQLIQMFKQAFKSLGTLVLRIFLFIKKNLFILGGLVLLGLGISFGLNQLTSKNLKSEVIVRPNFDSKNYLEDVVEEIQTNLTSKDKTFFETIGINSEDLEGFRLELEPIAEDETQSEEKMLNQLQYLQTLNNFKGEAFVKDILRSELTEKSVVNYKLIFQYVNAEKGPAIADKILGYINANQYFNSIKEVYANSARARIDNNKKLIQQIDEVVTNYSNSLKANSGSTNSTASFLEKEPVNVSSLLSLKNRFVEVIEQKQLELKQQSNVISILNYGKTQEVKTKLVENRFFMIPMILVLGFLAYCFIRYLNAKSKEIA